MSIVTLTINPALDKSTTVARVIPEQKLRCNSPKYDPGGGGINVARVIKRLGGDPTAIFQSAGPAGTMVEKLLDKEGVSAIPFATESWTRENLVVIDESTNQQYRFGMPGPTYTTSEQNRVFEILKKLTMLPEYLVISGSNAPGLPDNIYSKICTWASKNGIKVALDTSGQPLQLAVEKGVFLVKPNLKELSELAGLEMLKGHEQVEIAKGLVEKGQAEIIIVSLGPRGAMMVSRKEINYVTPPTVVNKSTVGAGDSMVAGMIWAFSKGFSEKNALRYGVACGTAATMNEGTELCLQSHVEDLFRWLKKQPYHQ